MRLRYTSVGFWFVVVALIVAGLEARLLIKGLAGDVAGGAFYTALIAILIVPLFRPHERVVRVWYAAAAALVISWVIELLQLTSFPADLAEAFPPARYLLGTTFTALDLVSAAIGALLFGVAVHRTLVEEKTRETP